MKTNEHFWSLEEMTQLNNLIKTKKDITNAAREFAKTSNRTYAAISYKTIWLSKRGIPEKAGVTRTYKSTNKVNFWSPAEIEIATQMLNKCNNNVALTSRKLSKKLKNRSERCIVLKLYTIKKGIVSKNDKPATIKVIKTSKEDKRGLTLPAGFSFDFTPKRAEMFKDHVKLYF